MRSEAGSNDAFEYYFEERPYERDERDVCPKVGKEENRLCWRVEWTSERWRTHVLLESLGKGRK